MRRPLRVVAGLAVAAAGVAAAWWAARPGPPALADFPADDDVAGVTAALFLVEGLGTPVPEFVVPPEYVPPFLRAFRPAERYDYPAQWDEEPLGRLVIRTHAGREYRVTFGFSGTNKLCYNVDGVRCVRGGPFEPVWVRGNGPTDRAWTAECLAVAGLIRELYAHARGGQRVGELGQHVRALEASAGRLPPASGR